MENRYEKNAIRHNKMPAWNSILQITDYISQGNKIPQNVLFQISKELCNPNLEVVFNSIQALESCMKICGSPFHMQVISRPFILELKNYVKAITNENVRSRIFDLIGAWACVFRNKTKYSDLQDTFQELKLIVPSHIPRNNLYITKQIYYYYNLYRTLQSYTLTYNQLKMYGFPIESPDQPRRIIYDGLKLERGSTKRHCCRCNIVFHILPSGVTSSDTKCHYHPRKRRYRENQFPCCGGDKKSNGCCECQEHVTTENFLHDVDFFKTLSNCWISRYRNELADSTVYAIDCEMVYTTAGMEVAKVGVVNIDGLVIFESFVLPQNKVLDYNTIYSGVTEKDLKGATTTLAAVQTYLLHLLNENSILIGHGLENDLKGLRIIHKNVVDTSIVFPGLSHNITYKKSLKVLAKEFLNKDIQRLLSGHNCIEDAQTCMELMLHKIGDDIHHYPIPIVEDMHMQHIDDSYRKFAEQQQIFALPKQFLYGQSYINDSYRKFAEQQQIFAPPKQFLYGRPYMQWPMHVNLQRNDYKFDYKFDNSL